mmetsp:Transcript_15593/g.39646  ORF Transcript_15593/g.39646 Transcript_15593/m.39646 type:complete len:206 (-) Transcript_15593:1001-1618(-)
MVRICALDRCERLLNRRPTNRSIAAGRLSPVWAGGGGEGGGASGGDGGGQGEAHLFKLRFTQANEQGKSTLARGVPVGKLGELRQCRIRCAQPLRRNGLARERVAQRHVTLEGTESGVAERCHSRAGWDSGPVLGGKEKSLAQAANFGLQGHGDARCLFVHHWLVPDHLGPLRKFESGECLRERTRQWRHVCDNCGARIATQGVF